MIIYMYSNVRIVGIHVKGSGIYPMVPCRIQMEIPYGMMESTQKFYMEWDIKNGWDLSQKIFHMEQVESIWNDMESTWNPCGMWGEGKDLA